MKHTVIFTLKKFFKISECLECIVNNEAIMTPQKFIKEIYPNVKDVKVATLHAIVRYSGSGEPIVLAYNNTSAEAWLSAKENIISFIKSRL